MTSTQKFISSAQKGELLSAKLNDLRRFSGLTAYRKMKETEITVKVKDIQLQLEELIKKYAVNYPAYCEHLIKTYEYIENRRKQR